MNSELVLLQTVEGVEVWDGTPKERHVKIAIGWYADSNVSFEVMLLRPMVHRSEIDKALYVAQVHLQEKGLKQSLLKGKAKQTRKKRDCGCEKDSDGNVQTELF